MLRESKQVLGYVGLGTDAFVRINGKLVRRICIRCGILAMLVLCVAFQCALCMQKNIYDLHSILLPFVTALTCVSMILTYISLVLKTERIKELFDYVQHLIDKSTNIIIY